MLRLLPALLLVSCAAELAPRADPGDPRVLPLGAVAALDGSFSEGDDLSFAWSVEPVEGVLLRDAESPFATLIAEAPGVYTLRLEVCDAAGRCDVAETWARVDDPARAGKITDFGLGEFAGAESGAGVLSAIGPTKSFCKQCFENTSKTSSEWEAFCRELEKQGASKEQRAKCWAHAHKDSGERANYCRDMGCRG